MYLDRDRPYEACEVLEDAVREVRELYGANSFEDADVLNHLGEAEVAAGRRQRAAAAFQGARESLSYWQIVNGGGPEVSEAEHLASAPSEQALAARVLDKRLTISEGRNLVKLGEHMKAEALLRRHLAFEEDEHRTEMGGFSLAIVPAIDLLAYVKMNQGTEAGYAESRALYERALAVTEVQVRDDNLQLLRRYENLGMACFRARDWPASQAWFRRADALLKAVGREDDDEDVQRVVRNISQAARMEHEQHLREQQAKLDEKRKAKEKKLRAMGLM
uniref:MalT-like TPR region domain-containing protein n=1 Tax=Phaeomonas parva TaxID=124430 RepID=A0A7S1U2G7_9STRA